MDFRVYVVIDVPILEKKYEILVPIDRKIHEVISLFKKAIPELSEYYYKDKMPNVYNKNSGNIYDMNTVIKDSDIRTGTRLLLI